MVVAREIKIYVMVVKICNVVRNLASENNNKNSHVHKSKSNLMGAL